MLSFKKSPNFESPTDRNRDADSSATPPITAEAEDNNVYLVTVRATEVRAPGATGATESTTQDITVTVKNVDELGTATITLRQPQVATALTAGITDPDGTVSDQAYRWEVPKVSRAVLDNDAHWQLAAGSGNTTINFTPATGDVGDFLRLKVVLHRP